MSSVQKILNYREQRKKWRKEIIASVHSWIPAYRQLAQDKRRAEIEKGVCTGKTTTYATRDYKEALFTYKCLTNKISELELELSFVEHKIELLKIALESNRLEHSLMCLDKALDTTKDRWHVPSCAEWQEVFLDELRDISESVG